MIITSILSFLLLLNLRQHDPKTAAVDSLFSHYNTTSTTGASVMVIRNGEIIYNHAFGLADMERKVPATQQSNYRIASITKQFTAMAIMMLKEDGKLSLDDRLNKFFPSLPAYTSEITIRRMLNHTAGLPSYGDLIPPDRTEPLTDTDVLHLIEKTDTAMFSPGSKFEYSNTAYVLLGLVVAKVSGMPYGEFLKKRIFEPAGMAHTMVNSKTDSIPNRAYGYTLKEDKLIKKDQSRYSYLLGDGGVYSSVEDFYKWDQALYTSKLVKPETLKEIMTESSKEGDIPYGYGWYLQEKYGTCCVWHSGGTSGFSTYYARYPKEKFSVILFANQADGISTEDLGRKIEDIYMKEITAGK
jgi:CubicO group peptidase (beta-lactamase class C family)